MSSNNNYERFALVAGREPGTVASYLVARSDGLLVVYCLQQPSFAKGQGVFAFTFHLITLLSHRPYLADIRPPATLLEPRAHEAPINYTDDSFRQPGSLRAATNQEACLPGHFIRSH